MKKRFLSIILMLCMLLTLLPSTALADSEIISGELNEIYVAKTDPSLLPTKADFETGPEWDGVSEPTRQNGNWAQSYAVIDALTEQAAAYADVAAEITFTLACRESSSSAAGEFLKAWVNAVTVATEGAVDINIDFSGAYSGTMAVVDDMVSGTIDFAWTQPCNFNGRFPLTNVIQNPALGIEDAAMGSVVMWELYKSSEFIQAEYEEGEVLFLGTGGSAPLAYHGEAEINSVDEISGNMRGNNGPTKMFIAAVGGSILDSHIFNVYTDVACGILSYVISDWSTIRAFSLCDPIVLNYFVDTNVGSTANVLMANNDVWAMLEDAGYADAVKSVSGDYLLNMVDIWNYWEALGRYAALDKGGTIYAPSAEFEAELRAAYEAVAEMWIEATGEGTQEVYDAAKELVEWYKHEHNYVSDVTVPTCTAEGYTTHSCPCGESYIDSKVAATGHKWDEGKVTKEPSEEAEGEKTFTCTVCGEIRSETVAKLEHTHKYADKVTAPSCTEDGYTTHTCPCGESYIDSKVAATGHKWDEGKVTKEPSEEAEGEKTFTCTVCGETRTEVIAKLEHTHKYADKVTAPTCTEDGYTTHSCACGDSYVDSKVAATGHKWDEGKVTKEPSEEAEGEKTFTCSTCGETKAEQIAKLEPVVNPFNDIAEEDYYFAPVMWAVQKGVTSGLSADSFGPAEGCTRAQVVTFLWRAAGEPTPKSGENPFKDVAEGQYYYNAVLWAVENGITSGLSADSFGPDANCNRGQIVTFLWRAAGEPAPTSDANPFKDVDKAMYYYNAVLWAVENGITSGVSADSFAPDTTCTRGQIVTFLYRNDK